MNSDFEEFELEMAKAYAPRKKAKTPLDFIFIVLFVMFVLLAIKAFFFDKSIISGILLTFAAILAAPFDASTKFIKGYITNGAKNIIVVTLVACALLVFPNKKNIEPKKDLTNEIPLPTESVIILPSPEIAPSQNSSVQMPVSGIGEGLVIIRGVDSAIASSETEETTTAKPDEKKYDEEQQDTSYYTVDYIANLNSKKFHYPQCEYVKKMSESNKWYYTGTREDLISQSYVPCKVCCP